MTKRKMFFRMITASLIRRRGRMLVALLSIGVGATILAGLVTVYVDVPRQMAASFRSYGANMVLLPADGDALSDEDVGDALGLIDDEKLVGATPYRYVRLNQEMSQLTFTTAGTDFEQVKLTSPYFGVNGEYPSAQRQILAGKNVAETLGLKTGSVVELGYRTQKTETVSENETLLEGSAAGYMGLPVNVSAVLDSEGNIETLILDLSKQTEAVGGRCADEEFVSQFIGRSAPFTLGEDIDAVTGATVTSQAIVNALNGAETVTNTNESVLISDVQYSMKFTVTGILETGGEEEDYIYMSLSDLGDITHEGRGYDVVEMSISGSSDELNQIAENINASGVATARLVKRVTRSEAGVIGKLQALVFLVTAVVLVLTMISVSTTMTAVVSERRREIGLRKALGASDNSIRAQFLGEGLFLGLLGGIIGSILGYVFALVVSRSVFASDLRFNFLLVPATILVSMAVSALSCLIPVRNAVAIDPALVLKGE